MATELTSERSLRASSTTAGRRSLSRSRYARLAVRGFVIAGFAGAAWLLTSSAAHASSAAHGADVPGLVNVLDGGVATAPSHLISGVLPPSGKPAATLHGSRHANHHGSGTWRSDLLGTVSHPVPKTVHAKGGAKKKAKALPSAGHGRKRHVARLAVRDAAAGVQLPLRSGTVVGADGVMTTHSSARRQHAEVSGRHVPTMEETASVDPRRTLHVPSLPRPAPVPVLPGEGFTSGVPGTGSGLGQDGGAPVIVPAATAAIAADANRPDTAGDVEVRRQVAESPTVSPD
jgi:hypothetical protein